MVRQVNPKRPAAWKAALALFVAAGALLWHLLACTDSPMAFSPDGSELAFVTLEPFDLEKAILAGQSCYRLMVVSDAKRLRIIETTTDHMLTAPAYSPDGKRLCYLRIPLLTKKQADELDKAVKRRAKMPDIEPPSWPLAPGAKTRPSTITGDRSLPDLEETFDRFRRARSEPTAPAELVLRDAQTFRMVKTLPVDLPFSGWHYLLIRPQYSPDGRRIYFCVGDMAMVVEAQTGRHEILAAPAAVAALSPDGKTLATLTERRISFVRTSGDLVVHRRLPQDVKPAVLGLAWIDEKTVALTGSGPGEDASPTIYTYQVDGRLLAAKVLRAPGLDREQQLLELAISPDGTRMVACSARAVWFMTRDGKVLSGWKVKDTDKFGLFRPTFTPDSKHVAFRLLTDDEDDRTRTSAIVFFTRDGKEVSRVAIPKIEPGTTRPAE